MTNYSTLTANATTLTFRGDDRYSVNWNLFKAVSVAYPNGEGALGSGGHSLTDLDISGFLVSDIGGDGSVDKQLFDILLPLVRDDQEVGVPAIVVLYLRSDEDGGAAEYVTLDGWVRNFIADRDTTDGQEMMRISFNILMRINPVYTVVV